MKLEVTKTVNIPHATLWEAASDFGGVQKFNPVVETSNLIGDTPNQGVGIKRVCNFYDGSSIVETVTQWEDKKGYRVELSEMNMPLKQAFGSLYVEAIDDKTSKMTMVMEFTPKYGVLGLIMGALLKAMPTIGEEAQRRQGV
jgi:hypothetical protein